MRKAFHFYRTSRSQFKSVFGLCRHVAARQEEAGSGCYRVRLDSRFLVNVPPRLNRRCILPSSVKSCHTGGDTGWPLQVPAYAKCSFKLPSQYSLDVERVHAKWKWLTPSCIPHRNEQLQCVTSMLYGSSEVGEERNSSIWNLQSLRLSSRVVEMHIKAGL